jgi:hypothetical protein
MRASYSASTTSYWGVRTIGLWSTPVNQRCILNITLGENPTGNPNVFIRIGNVNDPAHTGVYAANATHSIEFISNDPDSDLFVYKDGGTVAGETFVVESITLSTLVYDTNQIQTVTGLNGTFQTFVTDPWFGAVVVPNGTGGFEIETDANGDVIMYDTTSQSAFLVGCPIGILPPPPVIDE